MDDVGTAAEAAHGAARRLQGHPPAIRVRMSHAGRLHLKREGAPRMLCGVPAEGGKPMTPGSWESEDPRFKCHRCMAIQTQVARPT